MKRFLIIAVLLILVAATIIKIDGDQRKALVTELAQRIFQAREGNTSFRISEITNFDWDTLFIFPSYSDLGEIDETIGRFWLNSRFTQIEWSDGICLLVFMNNGRVINTSNSQES